MQNDIMYLLMANVYFSLRIAPLVVIGVGLLKGILLLTGQKREFEGWTRNSLLTVLSIVFLPGSLVYIGIRYILCRLLRIDVSEVGSSATYGEVNIFLRIDNPPRVMVLLLFLYTTVVLSIFTANSLILLPALFLADNGSAVLICWYVAIGIFFNTSVRSGDISVLFASLKRRPRSGTIELVLVMLGLIILYTQVMGVVV